MLKKILIGVVIVLIVVIVGFVGFIHLTYDKNYNTDYPVMDLKIVSDSLMIEQGRYLARGPAHCVDCHTERDLKSGKFMGEDYAGGMTFGPDTITKGWVFISPNLTSDEQTGIMTDWDEDDFVARMSAGRVYETSPMPWGAFQKIDDNDLKAIYRFFKTLKPVYNLLDNVLIPPTEN